MGKMNIKIFTLAMVMVKYFDNINFFKLISKFVYC